MQCYEIGEAVREQWQAMTEAGRQGAPWPEPQGAFARHAFGFAQHALVPDGVWEHHRHPLLVPKRNVWSCGPD